MPGVQRVASVWRSKASARDSGTDRNRLAASYRVISKAAEFERVLRVPARWRTEHFALHHCAATPVRQPSGPTQGSSAEGLSAPQTAELSTGQAPTLKIAVDDSAAEPPWLGLVVPKRFAKRAVTRALLKRRMRMAFVAAGSLRSGWWVCRLRAPFPVTTFPSARSQMLDHAVRAELAELLAAAQRPYRR